MFRCLHTAAKCYLKKFLIAGILLVPTAMNAQVCPTPGTAQACNAAGGGPIVFQKVTGLNLDGKIKGLLTYLPPGYNCSGNPQWPVIIYYGGFGSAGDGSLAQLCNIVTADISLPHRISNSNPPSVPWSSFIVVSPQWQNYIYPMNMGDASDFPSANAAEAVLNYVIATYNVDLSRIYMSGFSTGANVVIEYAGSSIARASRLAGIAVPSLCSTVGSHTNISGGINPQNIGNARLPVWFVQCTNELAPPNGCPPSIPQTWYTQITAIANNTYTRINILPATGTNPPPNEIYNCKTNPHNTWESFYDPNFRPGPPINTGSNVYEWLSAFNTLPVKLKSFSARLYNGKVYMKWVTSAETSNASFVIERSGTNQQYSELVTIKGSGNSNSEKTYEFVDDKPLANLSFYRLSQTDIDGKKQYFEIRKVMNRFGQNKILVVTPNPFNKDLSAFINVDKLQKVSVWITDMSGRKISGKNAIYQEGTTEVQLQTTSLPRGVYYLKAEGESFSQTLKIVKQ